MATQTKTKSKTAKSKSKSGTKSAPHAASHAAKSGLETVKRFDGKTAHEPAGVAFLMRQHREVEDYFEAYEKAEEDDEKFELAQKICLALAIHAQIEEELLYPEAKEKIEEEDLVDEANVEHATAKDLIAQLETMKVGDELYDAKVKVLGEYIKHHVEEEETELFPQTKEADMDLVGLGARLQARTEQLTAELTGPDGKPSGKRIGAAAAKGAHI